MSQAPDRKVTDTGSIGGLAYTNELNVILAALFSGNKGSVAPSDPVDNMAWCDDSADPVWSYKIYDEGDAEWITLFTVNTTTNKTNIANIDALNEYSKAQYYTQASLTDGATVDWDLDDEPNAKLTMGGDRTINNPTNIRAEEPRILKLVQDGTGTRNPSWGSKYDFTQLSGGIAPDLSGRAANKVDVFVFIGNTDDDKLECINHIQRA